MAREGARWEAPPAGALALAAGEVHVWRIALDVPDGTVGRLYALLDEGERARAERMRIQPRRRRHVVAHGAKRQILARYLGAPATTYAFTAGPHGKPALVPPAGAPALELNLSHSHELGLLALALARPLGVDVEHVREVAEPLRMAERFFRPEEDALLRSLPAAEQRLVFFRAWTRKEAYVKARGEALVAWLKRIEVPMLAGDDAVTTVAAAGEEGVPGRPYALVPLPVGGGYEAALALEGADAPALRLFRWP